jgi:hypothetical protein
MEKSIRVEGPIINIYTFLLIFTAGPPYITALD